MVFSGKHELYFLTGKTDQPGNNIYLSTSYDDFFSNDFFQRKDVFDQIIITKVDAADGIKINSRNVLYSSGPMAVMDTTFHRKER